MGISRGIQRLRHYIAKRQDVMVNRSIVYTIMQRSGIRAIKGMGVVWQKNTQYVVFEVFNPRYVLLHMGYAS